MGLYAKKMMEIATSLQSEGKLGQSHLAALLTALSGNSKDFEKQLLKSETVTGQEFLELKAEKAGLSSINLANYNPDNAVLKRITPSQAWLWRAVPLFESEGKITFACANPFDVCALDQIKREFSSKIVLLVALDQDIEMALMKYFGKTTENKEEKSPQANPNFMEVNSDDATGILRRLLEGAFKDGASDVHLEPREKDLTVRMRIDGVLEQTEVLPVDLKQKLLARLKIVAGMNVAEHRATQDGRASITVDDKKLDLRIAVYPTHFGEAAAIRLLSSGNLATLKDLGMDEEGRATFKKIIKKPNGIFLATGPTGSGKTTTLYAALQAIDRSKKHVLSIEDPIENQVPGVDQTEINVKAGVTFPAALRAILRQDPDVIMVGEIRDQETADIACRSAMTGHLVISTLHTNTALGAISRLLDLDVERFILSSTLAGVMSQRLVRKLCEACKVPHELSEETLQALGVSGKKIKAFSNKGCSKCRDRGFSGRLGLFEMIPLNKELVSMIAKEETTEEDLAKEALELGFDTLLMDGIKKIEQGLTTAEEVLKVCH